MVLAWPEPLLPDDLWDEIAPLLPPPRPRPKGGRRPIENRAALTGILFVVRSGLPWGDATGRDGLRLRHELLAAAAGLASGGRMEPPASRAAGSACTQRVRSTGTGLAWTARLFRLKKGDYTVRTYGPLNLGSLSRPVSDFDLFAHEAAALAVPAL